MSRFRRTLVVALLTGALAGCAASPPPRSAGTAPGIAAVTPAEHHNLNAVLWMQHAAEYEAVLRGAFNLAVRQLDAALADPDWDALPPEERAAHPLAGQPPAVIVDADETMIDNSRFQAANIRDATLLTPPRWEAWVDRRAARALPGALEFARAAADRGVTVLYVTNRRAPRELAATADNLRALGFELGPDDSHLLLSGDPRGPDHQKSGRRRWAAQHYRVLLMIGDNLGDFVDQGALDSAARNRQAQPYADWWGERWIMLPNPSYGGWERALLHDCAPELRERPLACKHERLRHD
jgi:5'-nucleotidase (lipoprotein e(P4) family)